MTIYREARWPSLNRRRQRARTPAAMGTRASRSRP